MSFVASQGIRGTHIDPALKEGGVLCHQGGQYYLPTGDGDLQSVQNFWGATNEVGQVFWRRNATFEPSKNQNTDWVDQCLSEIDIAFRWNKPAVINSHRVNYIGSIHEKNRTNSLRALRELLQRIVQTWPEVEFLSSEQLGLMLIESRN